MTTRLPLRLRYSHLLLAAALALGALPGRAEPEPTPAPTVSPEGVIAVPTAPAATPAPTPSPTPNGDAVVDRVEKTMGFDTKRSLLEMVIKTPWRTANYSMWVYSQGSEKTLIKFVAPASFRQTGFLRLGPEQIWVYTRQSEKVLKVTPNLIRSNFQGSDFSNEEFLKQSFFFRFRDYYQASFQGEVPLQGQPMYAIELKAKTAGSPYARMKMWVRTDSYWPAVVEFYNEDQGPPQKTLNITELKQIRGRLVGTEYHFRQRGSDSETLIKVLDTIIDEPLPPQVFTLQYLEKGV